MNSIADMSATPQNDEVAQNMQIPKNFDFVEAFLARSEELDTATDIRYNKYVLCSNLRFLRTRGGQPHPTVQDENWLVELFGNMEQFLVDGKDGGKEPCGFMQFFRRILYDLHCPTDMPNVNILIASHLEDSPRKISKTDESWTTALQDYHASFLQSRGEHCVVWLYFQFMDIPADPSAGPSETTIREVSEGLSSGPVEAGLPQKHVEPVPSNHDESQTLVSASAAQDLLTSSGKMPELTSTRRRLSGPSKPLPGLITPPLFQLRPMTPEVVPSCILAPYLIPDDPSGPPTGPGNLLQDTNASSESGTRIPERLATGTRATLPTSSLSSKHGEERAALVSKHRKISTAAGNPKRKVKDGPRKVLKSSKPAAPAEPEEKHTILTELALQARDGGVHDPDSLLPCTQLPDQEAFFRYCCGYLPAVNPEQHDSVRSVRLRNCKLAVTPHQFCTAVRMLLTESHTGIGGGLMALAPGLGKTYITLFLYALRTLLFTSRREVEIEWAEKVSKRTKKHLPRDAPPGRGLRCPSESQHRFGVRCYCVPDGLTRLTVEKLKHGVTLIQVPIGAMPSWLKAINDAKFDPAVYNIALFLPQASMPDGLRNNLGVVDNLKRGMKIGAVLPAQHPGGCVQHQSELIWEMQPPPLSRNHMALESYCFVTSHHSTALEETFQYGLNDLSPRPARVSEFPGGKMYALLVGITFIDESHRTMDPGSKPVQLARIHRHIRTRETGSDIWHVTATPFGAKFEDVMSAVTLLAPQLTNDVATLNMIYQLAKMSFDDAHNHALFEEHFQCVFNDRLVIRDIETTTFLDRPITDTQLVKPKFISSVIPKSQRNSMQAFIDADLRERLVVEWNIRDPSMGYLDVVRNLKMTNILYFLSLFPSAAEVLRQEGFPKDIYQDSKLSELIRSLPDTTGEAIAGCKVLTGLVERLAGGPRSPKVQCILDGIMRMMRDSTGRPDPNKESGKRHSSAATGVDLTLKKIVIITPTIATAVFLYLYLLRCHRGCKPLLYHRELKPSARLDIIRKFDSLKERNPWRIFIAPASVAGAGLNLQVANRMILTSPLLSRSDETQALARVNRSGQTLKVDLQILVSEHSPIDRIILADRARRLIISDPFTVDEDLKVGSYDADHNIGGSVHDGLDDPFI